MRVFVLPPAYKGEEEIVLTGKDFHYLINVLRLGRESSFAGRDLQGRSYHLDVKTLGAGEVTLACSPMKTSSVSNSPNIVLYQCICKGKKMDQIIRQSVEIGVKRIIPLLSDHTIPRIRNSEGAVKYDRWLRIAREAVQQSGSEVMTEIDAPLTLKNAVKDVKKSQINLFFHQNPLANHSLHGYLCGYPEEVSLLVGPEGGLSGEEVIFLQDNGFKAVYLKTNILRAETAAVYAISAVRSILTERENWYPVEQ